MFSSEDQEKNGIPEPIGNAASNAKQIAKYPSRNTDAEDDANKIDLNDVGAQVLIQQLIGVLARENRRPVEEKSERQGLSLSRVTAVWRRRWPLMVLVFLATTAVVLWRLQPGDPNYTATATLLLPQQAKTPNLDDLTQMRTAEVSSNVQTQIAILTSRPVVARAMGGLPQTLRVQGWGNKDAQVAEVHAAAPISNDLVDVTVVAADPKAAIALANAMVNIYKKRTLEFAVEEILQSIESARRQMEESRGLYLAAKQRLLDYQQQTGISDLPTQLSGTNTQIQLLTQQAQAAQVEAAAGAASNSVLSDITVNDLQQKANEARLHYQVVLRDLRPDAPEAQAARQIMADYDQLLKRRIQALVGQLQRKSSDLQSQLAMARAQSVKLPPVASKLNQLSSDVDLLESTYKSVLDRYTDLKLTRNAQVNTAKMVTPAIAAIPTGRTWTRVALMAVLCGLILAALTALLSEQIDNTVYSLEDLEGLLGLPVLGSIPLFQADLEYRLAFLLPSKNSGHEASTTALAKQGSVDQSAKNSAARPLLEACRILRSNLVFSTMDAPLRSVLVTSADPGDGKSLCAFNLATVMAYDGKRVILLDCDLRRPTQHKLASTPSNPMPIRPGFVDVMAGNVPIERALQTTPVENLFLMSAGTLPPNPPELLSSNASHRLIEELRDRCDLLIIDSPPLMFLSDSQVLSAVVDGTVLVVSANKTSRVHVQRAHEILRHAGSPVLGTIFNKVKTHNDPHAYYGYYYNYYSSDENDSQNGGDDSSGGQSENRKKRGKVGRNA